MSEHARPLVENKRLPWIDAARGIAIFGIFLVNIPTFNGPYFLYGNGQNYWGTGEPSIWQMILDIFFQASFYSLFSFLFGFGMQIIWENLEGKNITPNRIMIRRLSLLFLFGFIHAFFIWHGDILLTYSVIGFILLLFFPLKNQTLLITALCILLIPVLLYTGLLYLAQGFMTDADLSNGVAIAQSLQHYGNGSWSDIFKQNLADWFYANNPFNFIFILSNILPIFILGVVVARKKWLHDVTTYRPLLIKALVISFVLFVLFKAGPYAFGNPLWFTLLQDTIGGISSSIFYMLSITLLYPYMTRFFTMFAYVGKMALSNYLLQSIVSVFLFYSIGFRLYGKLGPLETVLVVCVVYVCQLGLSYMWLKRYKRGPMEWMWRSFIYKEKLANKRKVA
ncbi:DUF418 domain-containing protein [Gracilibacillus marinus]|uniref:DUF418 domain-containing protein n=1 Tax=Gracilibacillus marinus TaxID=630535 RepID=A0ABV8VT13_9BACI